MNLMKMINEYTKLLTINCKCPHEAIQVWLGVFAVLLPQVKERTFFVQLDGKYYDVLVVEKKVGGFI